MIDRLIPDKQMKDSSGSGIMGKQQIGGRNFIVKVLQNLIVAVLKPVWISKSDVHLPGRVSNEIESFSDLCDS